MKKTTALLITLINFLTSFSQTSNYWIQSAGSLYVDENMAIAKGDNNTIVSAGYFTNTITFPTGTTLTSAGLGTTDVLIQKTGTQGQVMWTVKAGGLGSDRATALACDANGNVYVTGYYYGTAQFGSFTLNSVGNTQDVFIAKLSSAGAFLWVKSAGGNLSETPNGLAVDNQSNVIITGEFQGAATFGTQTITSIVNPSNGSSSFDIFTCKYDANGNFVWVQQGSAKYDDRGLDVGTDANGNIFVCGQFSDTITFNQTHNNQIANAVFLIKYNAAGQEQWFVRAGATNSIAYGLAVDNYNDVYITGDYSGNLIFYGTPNNFLFGNYSNRIFLVKYNNAGSYIWGKEDASSSYVSSKDVALDANGNPCIFGEFDCRMDDYSVLAGGTGMFNSVGYHDLFITQYDKTGSRQWARNFGGPLYDKAHGIVFTNNTTPYVCGSFQKTLNINSTYPIGVLNYNSSSYQNWISVANCNNSPLFYYNARSTGFSDCFIMHGIDNTTPYYDYYYRNGVGCQQNFVKGCIDDMTFNCQDTLNLCGPDSIIANPYTGSVGYVGPSYHYLWNTGDTTHAHFVTTNANYSCVMTTVDGCFITQDTVYAKVNPIPQPPTITDSYSINVNQPPPTNTIDICGHTPITLTGGNLQGSSYQWLSASSNSIISTSGSSCLVNTSDYYTFILTNSFGCTNVNHVLVKFDTLEIVKPKTNMPDTVRVCQGACFNYFIYDSISNPAGLTYSCFTTLTNVVSGNLYVNGDPNCLNGSNNLSLTICPTAAGLINLHIMYVFSSTCGKDTAYFNKPVYIILNPNPQTNISFVGTNFICPGDSALLIATATVTPSLNTTYTITPTDSIWVNHAGNYQVGVYAIDTLTGCISYQYGNIQIQTVNNPVVHTLPANGLVCPNDSVELICNWPSTTSWEWHGPTGILPPNQVSIYDSIPGFYYCVATNSSGCVLTSNTVEIKKYNTPYLIALPQTVVCAGQLITLHVISNDTTLIQWLPPLSGGGTSQTVSQTGTYTCKITMCGITTTCSITVTVAQPIAHITVQGSTVICPGDSVQLTANTGMASYLWLPSNALTNSITAYNSGSYVLIATDGNGCQAKDSVSITYNLNTPPAPITTNDSICLGNSATLQASSSGNYTYEWYAQPYSGAIINTGNNFITPLLYQNTIYYVSVKDNTGCHSIRQTANVYIKPSSLLPTIWGDTALCALDTLNLHTNSLGGVTYNWSGPNNFNSSIQNPQINNVSAAANGTYSLYLTGSGCTSIMATLNVVVTQVSTPSILVANDSVCNGSSLTLQAQSSINNVSYSWSGANSFTSSNQTNTITNVTTINAGMYYVQTNLGICKSSVDSVKIIIKPTPIPTLSIQQSSCFGDTLMLMAQTDSNATINWTGPANFQSSLQMPILTNLTATNTGYYVCATTIDGCTGKDSARAIVNPLPNFNLGNDTITCASSPLVIYPGHFAYYMWNDSITDSTFIVQQTEQVTLTVLNQFGCKYSDTINIVVAQCLLSSPNVFSPNGDGINDIYAFKIDHYQTLDFSVLDRWGKLVYKNQNNENSWDGTDMQSKKVVENGVYFYHINAKTMLGTNATDNGFIQVFK